MVVGGWVEDATTAVVESEVELMHDLLPVACEAMRSETPPLRFIASVM